MIRLAIAGASGRTGRRVLERALHDDRFKVLAALTTSVDPLLNQAVAVGDDSITLTDKIDGGIDVLVDFTLPSGTMRWLGWCMKHRVALVSGVTGFSASQLEEINTVAEQIPLLLAPNFSVGINLLLERVGGIRQALGEEYDIEIVERHHNQKMDAPSGTAKAFLNALTATRPGDGKPNVTHGREGETGLRPKGEIGVHSLRGGDEVGVHEIVFSGPGETVTLTHRAHSRDAFAVGALRAASWIVGKPAGHYSLSEIAG